MTEEPIFQENTGSSFGSGGVSFKEIILIHLRRISILGCVEFSGGYWKTVFSSIGAPPEKVYIPDTGEIYMNAINCFSILLYPNFDEEMKKDNTEFKKNISNIQDKIKTSKDSVLHYSERIELHNDFLCSLGCFLKRENYLEAGTTED